MRLVVSPQQTSGMTLSRQTVRLLSGLYVMMLVLLMLSSAIFFGQGGEAHEGKVLFDNPLKPSYIYLLTYMVTAVLMCFVMLKWLPLERGGLLGLMVILGLMHLLWVPFANPDEFTARILVLRMNVVVMTICFQVILSVVTDLRSILTVVRWVGWGSSLLNVLVVVTPDLFPFQMNKMHGRAAGLYGDPNQCATFLAMMLPLMTYQCRRPARIAHYLVILIGIFFTFSREGALLWLAVVFLDLMFKPGMPNFKPRAAFVNLLSALAFVIFLIGGLAFIWLDLLDLLRPHLNADTYSRLNGTDQGSASERLFVLFLGWEMFAQHPIFGSGYAATHVWDFDVSVHNMFVLMLAEFGLIGGIWYVAFLWRIYTFPQRFGITVAVLMLLESLFTHSFFDLSYYMLLVMLYWRLSYLADKEAKNRAAPWSGQTLGISLQ